MRTVAGPRRHLTARPGLARTLVLVAATLLFVPLALIAPLAVGAAPAPTPTVAYPAPGLEEASGLAASAVRPGVVWVVEDSGAAIVRAYGPGGAAAGSVTLVPTGSDDTWGGDNRDSEALAIGPPPGQPDGAPQLWVADIGDNNAVRTSVVVHVTPEPDGGGDHTQEALSYRFTYPGGAHDAETLLVDPVDARAYIVTKSLIAGGFYAAPTELTPNATHELTLVSSAPGIISDGAFAPDGAHVVLRTTSLGIGSKALIYDVIRRTDRPIALGSDPVEVELPDQRQGESISFTADGTALLIGSEGKDEPIWLVPIPGRATTSGGPSPTTPVQTSADGDPTGTPTGSASRDSGDRWWLLSLGGGALVVLGAVLVSERRRRQLR